MADETRVLIVDDDPRNLDALEAMLEGDGYALLRATRADDALRLLLTHDVAAIVLDVQMPEITGFDLAKLIKGTKRHRGVPILFLTAQLLDDVNVLAGYDAGAADYLLKPVNPRILRQKVAVFVELFRKSRALAELNEHLELRVKERTEQLEEAAAQKDRFLATLAHELRNPLAPLRVGLDLVLRDVAHVPTATHALSVMDRQLAHMVRLIDDLLDVSRISRGTLALRLQRVNVADAVAQAVEITKPLLERRGQVVTTDMARDLWAEADATRIAQIVTNLLNNASKHSSEGATVRVEVARQDTAIIVRVIDSGIGISPDQIGRVFGMFVKIEHRTKTNDGLGIGLALSKQLAEMHQGTLAAASAGVGQGATFTLQLPLAAAPARDERLELPRSAGASPPQRIVVVEDGADTLELLVRWLEREGHAVHAAHNGPDGLDLILRERPDVVLCDIGLPGAMDGVELCRSVVAQLTAPPFMVAMTGWGADADRARTRAAGFQLHLVKPVAPHELAHALQQASRPSEGFSSG